MADPLRFMAGGVTQGRKVKDPDKDSLITEINFFVFTGLIHFGSGFFYEQKKGLI